MPIYYLETSALVKKYRTEKGTEVIGELFEGKQETEVFITSYLTVVEVTSVATRLLRARTLTRRAFQIILGNLSRDVRETIRLQSVTDGVLSEAVRLCLGHALRAPDAIHLATALRVRGAIPDEPFHFLVSDSRLKTAGENSGVTVVDPEAAGSIDALRSYRSSG